MNYRAAGQLHRLVAAATIMLLVLLLTAWWPTEVAVAQPTANSVQITVLQVTPTTPTASTAPRTLNVELQLTNTSDEDLGSLTVKGARGNPISNQTALDAAIAKPAPPDPGLIGKFTAKTPVTATLAPGATTTVTYASTTAASSAAAGLCLCQDRIYPLYFSVQQQLAGGKDVIVGSTQTYIPSFTIGSDPQPVRVSWVWPILERPHRTIRDTVFTDDDLATSVATGGRLDRVLQVVEDVENAGASIPMTLVVDPDLIDELAVMASGSYSVVTGPGHTAPGTGTPAAKAWLLRLRTVLDDDPAVEVSFTAPADPNVDSLDRNGLSWATSLGPAAQARVLAALGGHVVPSDVAWPVNGSLSSGTLGTLVGDGARAVIVDDTTLPGGKHNSPLPDALGSVPTRNGNATMAVTSAAIQNYAAQVVTEGGSGLAQLPELVSELAVRAVEDGQHAHYVVITPPRNVDPDPSTAEAAILQTTHTSWSQPLGLLAAGQTVTPVDHGKLAAARPGADLPDETISTARFVADSLPSLAGLIPNATQRTQLLGSLADGVQRSESSEWLADPTTGAKRAAALRNKIDSVTSGVLLVKPTVGTYTLGSADSPLPITIDNTLDAQVFVRVHVSAVNGLPGFSADDIGVKAIDPKSKLPLHIPVHVDRVGRIQVEVDLTTPDGFAIGKPLPPLSVRSTALGEIGKIITFVAGAVLAAALLFRVLRRWRKRSTGTSGTAGAARAAT